MNVWALIPLVSCLTYLGLLIIALQYAERPVNRVFALYVAVSSLWSFTSFMLHLNVFPQQTLLWNEILLIPMMWTSLSYYHFTRSYSNKPAGIVVYIGYLLLAVLTVLSLNGNIVKSAYIVDGILYHDLGTSLYVIGAASLTIVALVIQLLVRRYRNYTDPVDRNRTMYLIWGWGLLVFFGYTNLIPVASGLSLDHLGNLFNAMLISYAIFKFQLLNIRLVARRGLSYILLLAFLIGIYLGSIILWHKLFPGQPLYLLSQPFPMVVLALALVILLALLARPLRSIIQEGIDHIFYRETYASRQTLLNFSSRMSNIINLNELAEEMLPVIVKALHLNEAKLLFQDSTGEDFTTQFTYPEVKDINNELKFKIDNPIVAWLDKKGRPLNLEQIDAIPELKGLWESEKEQLAKSNLGLLYPIKSRGKLIGILTLGSKRGRHYYSHEDMELLNNTANEAGILIENAHLYTQAKTRANTDGLTGLYNHRHFHERLEQEIARSSRFGSRFSLIMMDLDLFKTYNDIYGHLAGDKILRRVADAIKSSVRSVDMAFRYGGEEFTAILPEASLDGAYKVAERIRNTVESKASSKAMPVTVSLGIASWPADGITGEELIACADAALYRAKQTGRNRICLSSDIVKPKAGRADIETAVRRGPPSIVYALAATVDAKDHHTYGHSKKVAEYAVTLAQALGLSQDKIAIIRAAALLHDIGKIGIPDAILNKEGTLTPEEWEPVKIHPELGVDILKHVVDLAGWLPAGYFASSRTL